MNREKLLKLRDQLKEVGDRNFNYHLFIASDRNEPTTKSIEKFRAGQTDCGTMACVAGWHVVMNMPHITDNVSANYEWGPVLAKRDLDLSDEEAQFLFYPWDWAKNNIDTEERSEHYRTRILVCDELDTHFTLDDAIDRINYLLNHYNEPDTRTT